MTSEASESYEEITPDDTIRILALKLFSAMPKPSMIDLADLQQAGSLGLLQARRTYDASMGVPLAAYAKHRIRGEMLEAGKSGPAIRCPAA
jgi:RNA polymerase sigma factor for flagellar operon FliA